MSYPNELIKGKKKGYLFMEKTFDMNTFIQDFKSSCAKVQVKEFDKGETITTYIEKRNQLCILESGEAELIRYDFNGTKTIIRHYNQHSIFGEVFYPANTNNEHFVTAKKKCKVLVYIYDNIDYYAVDRFNILIDNLLASAYNEQNKTATKESIKAFYKNFVDFVYNGQKLYCRPLDMEYTFADLSPSAQHTILSMGLGVLTVEYNFNATIDGKKCDRVSIGTKTEELRQQVYETLSQNQKIRR